MDKSTHFQTNQKARFCFAPKGDSYFSCQKLWGKNTHFRYERMNFPAVLN
jgi:hypothetical protein